jgi:deazaflavin-dependent oxidoreductase (nitroreductase family)
VTSLPARRSVVWAVVFRVSYRLLRLLDPLIRSWIANGAPGLDGIVELRTVGRRSGRPRRTFVTLLSVDERFYVGHPNGTAEWLANLLASGWVDVDPPGAGGPRYSVDRLPPGAERDAVIRATWTQQPFPANLLYRAARRHVAAVGEYIRLTPTRADGPLPATAAVH